MVEYATLLRGNRNYRFLWLSAVTSYLGDWFNLIASAELIQRLSGGGTAVSYLFLARFLPSFLMSPFAGVLADRFDRQRLMVVADVLRALTVLCFLLVRSADQLWLLYALTALQFALSALFIPAKSAVLANVVPQRDLVTANALDSTTWSVMLAFGALLGGVVTGLFGAETAFIADALTFLLSAVIVTRIELPVGLLEARRQANADRRGLLDFVDGLRYLWGLPLVLCLALVKAGGSLIWGALNVLEVEFASKVFPLGEGGATTLGLIYAVAGVGTGVGPILMRRWLGDLPARLRWGILAGLGLMTLGTFGLSIAPTLPLFLAATLLRTFGTGTLWVFSAALLQMLVEDRMRGRVFAFEFAAFTLTQSISILWAGWGQDWLGLSVREVLVVTAGVGVLVTAAWLPVLLIWRRRELAVSDRAPGD